MHWEGLISWNLHVLFLPDRNFLVVHWFKLLSVCVGRLALSTGGSLRERNPPSLLHICSFTLNPLLNTHTHTHKSSEYKSLQSACASFLILHVSCHYVSSHSWGLSLTELETWTKNTLTLERVPFTHFTHCSWRGWPYRGLLLQRPWLLPCCRGELALKSTGRDW